MTYNPNQTRHSKGSPRAGAWAPDHARSGPATAQPEASRVVVAIDEYGSARSWQDVAASNPSMESWLAESSGRNIKQDLGMELDEGESFDLECGYEHEGIRAEVVGTETGADIRVEAQLNLLSDWDHFSEAQLDVHRPVVERYFQDRFHADVDVQDSWASTRISMSAPLLSKDSSKLIASSKASDMAADFLNATDPGTYGQPYFGNELRDRIGDEEQRRDAAQPQLEVGQCEEVSWTSWRELRDVDTNSAQSRTEHLLALDNVRGTVARLPGEDHGNSVFEVEIQPICPGGRTVVRTITVAGNLGGDSDPVRTPRLEEIIGELAADAEEHERGGQGLVGTGWDAIAGRAAREDLDRIFPNGYARRYYDASEFRREFFNTNSYPE